MQESAAKPLILVVDDDAGLVRLVEKALRRVGCQTSAAASGQQAMEWLDRGAPDLILLDLNLPDLSGPDLIDQLTHRKKRVPFIVITGQGDERLAVEIMKRGATEYLVKDRDLLERLPAVVQRVLGQIERDRKLAAAEEALRRENALTSAVLDTSGALVVALDPQGRIARFNRACEETTGYSFAEIKGKTIWETFIAPEERDEEKKRFAQLSTGLFPSQHETYWIAKNGERRWIAWSNTALLDPLGAVEYVIGSGLDMTEKKRLEKEILEISDRERRRFGQDLHDGLGQHLAGTELMSQVLEQQLAAKRLKTEAAQAGRIAEHVREAIAQTRLLASGLSPVSLEAEGLMSALQEVIASTERLFHVRSQFHCAEPVLIRDNAAATHLYRIAQEAINNAIKHGKSNVLSVELAAEKERRRLSIRDYGVGFNPNSVKHSGLGLRIMQYRAAMIGGALEIRSYPGEGTTVACFFPLQL